MPAQKLQGGWLSMREGCRPADRSTRRLASRRSRCVFESRSVRSASSAANRLATSGPHLKTTRSDGRPEGGDQVVRVAAKLRRQFVHGARGDAGDGALPAGMDRGDGAVARVGDQDGDAVGSLDGNCHAGFGSCQSVAFGLAADEGGRGGQDVVGVDLFEVEIARGRAGQGGSEAVFEPGLGLQQGGGIESVGAEVEAHAAGFLVWLIMTLR